MSAAGWIVLLVIGSFVWGGFAGLLSRALRSERWKRQQSDASDADTNADTNADTDAAEPGEGAR